MKQLIKNITIQIYKVLTYLIPVNKKMIIFQSSNGRNYTGNPRYIYEEMVREGLDQEYECIWFFFDTSIEVPGKCKKIRNNYFPYFWYLMRAGIWAYISVKTDEDDLLEALEEAKAVKEILDSNTDFVNFLNHPQITKEEKMEAAKNAGARDMIVLNEALAAAIGAGLPVSDPVGNMVVDIGGGTTDSAVVVVGGIACPKSVRTGGTHIDKAIVEYIAREYKLSIGERTAEQIKLTLGSALMGGDEHMEVRGRSMDTGLPKSIVVGQGEISYAIIKPVRRIVGAIKDTLAETPPELAGDIYTNGITLTGGGAMLDGLAEYVSRETQMEVRVADEAENCVVLGALKALDIKDRIDCIQDGELTA